MTSSKVYQNLIILSRHPVFNVTSVSTMIRCIQHRRTRLIIHQTAIIQDYIHQLLMYLVQLLPNQRVVKSIYQLRFNHQVVTKLLVLMIQSKEKVTIFQTRQVVAMIQAESFQI